jgi:hypothetical protein
VRNPFRALPPTADALQYWQVWGGSFPADRTWWRRLRDRFRS